jgi:hypothetical protein
MDRFAMPADNQASGSRRNRRQQSQWSFVVLGDPVTKRPILSRIVFGHRKDSNFLSG